MLRSLRARLAFLFVGTLLLATVLAGVVVVSLYQSYSRDQTVTTLRMQVNGVALYYNRAIDQYYTMNGNTQAAGGLTQRLRARDRRPPVLRRPADVPR